jgi:hypothetical protein
VSNEFDETDKVLRESVAKLNKLAKPFGVPVGASRLGTPLASVSNEPLAKQARKVYRATKVYELDQLLAEESRWKRKVTIASNKLAEVRTAINKLASELAHDTVKDGGGK